MVQITFLSADDEKYLTSAETGTNLMQLAVLNSVPGIDAECGGTMSCATCHVHLDEKGYECVPKPKQAELDMLEFTDNPCATSRLSCQITVTSELDGLIVKVPAQD